MNFPQRINNNGAIFGLTEIIKKRLPNKGGFAKHTYSAKYTHGNDFIILEEDDIAKYQDVPDVPDVIPTSMPGGTVVPITDEVEPLAMPGLVVPITDKEDVEMAQEPKPKTKKDK